MKKTLLAAALVTGFAGVAHAESSVTLYGLVDTGYGYTQQKTTAKFQGETVGSYKERGIGARQSVKNGSRWGMKGVEDLGNGTSAIFQLESGFNSGNGFSSQDGRLFGRQAFVGLTGESWGTFTIGRQYNVADAFIAPIDPFGTGWGQASVTKAFGDSPSARYDNAIKYVSPNFSGFQFGLGVFQEDKKYDINDSVDTYTRKDKRSGVTLGAGYNAGPLAIGASFDYARVKTSNSNFPVGHAAYALHNTDAKTKAWNLGVAYDLDVVKLHAIVGQQRDGAIGGLGLAGDIIVDFDSRAVTGTKLSKGNSWNSKGLRQTSWLAGVSAPVGDAGKVLFSYTGNNIKHNDPAFDGDRIRTNIFSLGYQHNLSKRTQVYAVASYGTSKLRNKNVDASLKLKSTDVAVGLQHRF